MAGSGQAVPVGIELDLGYREMDSRNQTPSEFLKSSEGVVCIFRGLPTGASHNKPVPLPREKDWSGALSAYSLIRSNQEAWSAREAAAAAISLSFLLPPSP